MANDEKPVAPAPPTAQEAEGIRIARREFMKLSGLAAAAFGAVSVFGAGYANGQDPSNQYSWENTKADYFDRTPFEVDRLPYNVLRKDITRVSYMDIRQNRYTRISQLDLKNMAGLPADLQEYYKKYPDKYELDKRAVYEIKPAQEAYMKEHGADWALHSAFFGGWSSVIRNDVAVAKKPEEYDFEGARKVPYEIKDPAEMTKLIKQVGRLYGSGLVRVAKLNPAWVYEKHTGGRGYKTGEEIKVPDWWQYAIVVGVPHEWEAARANPSFGHSVDAYNISTIIAARLTYFIKQLGYAARPHSPNAGYEVILPPILADSGCGEQGRMGFVITPEFGANFRPAVITTNLPLLPDKPIDIGVRKFCEHCKICAEECPSQSISFDGPQEIRGRGVDGWQINIETCHNFWLSVPGSGSCRICLINCPWSKRSDWLHTTARDAAVRDKTGAVAAGLTWMEKNFYGMNGAAHYEAPNYGTYREAPWWFDVDRFLTIKK